MVSDTVQLTPQHLAALAAQFGPRLQLNASLARYTAARLGGPADALVEILSAAELAAAAAALWQAGLPFAILGGGSNVLVSDAGARGVVLVNRARQVRFDLQSDPPGVWAESGANFGALARQAAQHGLSGLEWAAGIPGTLGGAVVGNAGAHGSDMAANLVLAEILQHQNGETPQPQAWPVAKLEYAYRSSRLKRSPGPLVLAAHLRLEKSTPEAVQARMDGFSAQRRRTQPPGASLGSMFKNPPGDYAGRLIEAAGLKGARSGAAEISTQHANFFINNGNATAADLFALLRLARTTVARQFGVQLEPEIELFGAWDLRLEDLE